MRRTVCAVALCLLLAPGSFLSAEVYRWEDDKGVIHFTDNPLLIPPKYEEKVKEQKAPKKKKKKEASSPELQVPLPATEGQPGAAQTDVDYEGHDKEWWQAQIKNWEGQREAAKGKLEKLRNELGSVRFKNISEIQRQNETNKLLAKIEETEGDIRGAEEMLEVTLPEEARKAGAPPGWLR